MPIDMSKPTRAEEQAGPGPTADQVAAESRAADTPPKRRPGRPPKAQTTAADTSKIANSLGIALSIPAIPAEMLGEKWIAQHFNTQGPELAKVLAKASENNPRLRAWLLTGIDGSNNAMLFVAVLSYVVPPVVYFGLADDHPVRGLMSVPSRKRTPPVDPATNGTPDTAHTPNSRPS
jgi:hypothetical protein